MNTLVSMLLVASVSGGVFAANVPAYPTPYNNAPYNNPSYPSGYMNVPYFHAKNANNPSGYMNVPYSHTEKANNPSGYMNVPHTEKANNPSGYMNVPHTEKANSHDDHTSDKLGDLAEAIHHVSLQKDALQEKVDILGQKSREFFLKLKNMSLDFDTFFAEQADLFTRIKNTSDIVEHVTKILRQLEARAASAALVAKFNLERVDPLARRRDALVKVNIEQDAKLEEIKTLLHEYNDDVESSLQRNTEDASADIVTIIEGIKNVVDISNSRSCLVQSVEVCINDYTGVGEAKVNITHGFFKGGVPQVFCGLQGQETSINVRHSQAIYGYGSSANGYGSYKHMSERQSASLQIDCTGFEDKIKVKALDLSQGKGNQVHKIWVQVRACSFPSVPSF